MLVTSSWEEIEEGLAEMLGGQFFPIKSHDPFGSHKLLKHRRSLIYATDTRTNYFFGRHKYTATIMETFSPALL